MVARQYLIKLYKRRASGRAGSAAVSTKRTQRCRQVCVNQKETGCNSDTGGRHVKERDVFGKIPSDPMVLIPLCPSSRKCLSQLSSLKTCPRLSASQTDVDHQSYLPELLSSPGNHSYASNSTNRTFTSSTETEDRSPCSTSTHELLASLTLILGLFKSSLSLWLCSVKRRSLSSDMDCL